MPATPKPPRDLLSSDLDTLEHAGGKNVSGEAREQLVEVGDALKRDLVIQGV